MAANVDEQNRLTDSETTGADGRGNGPGNEGQDSSHSRSDSGRAGRGRGTGRGTNTSEEKLPKLVDVKEPKPVTVDIPGESPEEKKARNAAKQKAYRERKKQEKAASTTTKKATPKKATAAKKSPVLDNSAIHVKAMLSALSGVVSSRDGMAMWALSEAEIDSIVNPLTNMMARNEAVGQALEQHGDAVALVMAVTVIALPRVIMMQQMKKLQAPVAKLPSVVQKGDKDVTTRNQPRTESDSQGTAGSSNGSTHQEGSRSHSIHGESLSSHLPALGF